MGKHLNTSAAAAILTGAGAVRSSGILKDKNKNGQTQTPVAPVPKPPVGGFK